LIFGVVEHVRYFGKKDDFVKAGCGTNPTFLATRPDCQSINNQFKSANTWWVVGYVASAVLGGAGAYFLWLAPGDAATGREHAAANVDVTVNFSGRF
jgi:hypothetical protein